MGSFYDESYITSQILDLEYTGKTEIEFDVIPSMNNAYYAKGGILYEDTNLLCIEVYDYDYENNNSVNMNIEIYTKEFLENI